MSTSNKKLQMPIIVASIKNENNNGTPDMWTREDIQVNNYLAEVYKNGYIIDDNGVKHKFIDVTNPIEGRHLYNLIRKNKFKNILEVGFAMGASSAWICQALHDNGGGMDVVIDPNQSTQYKNLGNLLINKAGLSPYLHLIEKPSYQALPEILNNNAKLKFDLVYIDGFHTFDYTLIDFFYANLLLRKGGVIVVDDIRHKSVNKFIKYVMTNYKHYKLVKKTPAYEYGNIKNSSQATFIKMADDTRAWNFHQDF